MVRITGLSAFKRSGGSTAEGDITSKQERKNSFDAETDRTGTSTPSSPVNEADAVAGKPTSGCSTGGKDGLTSKQQEQRQSSGDDDTPSDRRRAAKCGVVQNGDNMNINGDGCAGEPSAAAMAAAATAVAAAEYHARRRGIPGIDSLGVGEYIRDEQGRWIPNPSRVQSVEILYSHPSRISSPVKQRVSEDTRQLADSKVVSKQRTLISSLLDDNDTDNIKADEEKEERIPQKSAKKGSRWKSPLRQVTTKSRWASPERQESLRVVSARQAFYKIKEETSKPLEVTTTPTESNSNDEPEVEEKLDQSDAVKHEAPVEKNECVVLVTDSQKNEAERKWGSSPLRHIRQASKATAEAIKHDEEAKPMEQRQASPLRHVKPKAPEKSEDSTKPTERSRWGSPLKHWPSADKEEDKKGEEQTALTNRQTNERRWVPMRQRSGEKESFQPPGELNSSSHSGEQATTKSTLKQAFERWGSPLRNITKQTADNLNGVNRAKNEDEMPLLQECRPTKQTLRSLSVADVSEHEDDSYDLFTAAVSHKQAAEDESGAYSSYVQFTLERVREEAPCEQQSPFTRKESNTPATSTSKDKRHSSPNRHSKKTSLINKDSDSSSDRTSSPSRKISTGTKDGDSSERSGSPRKSRSSNKSRSLEERHSSPRRPASPRRSSLKPTTTSDESSKASLNHVTPDESSGVPPTGSPPKPSSDGMTSDRERPPLPSKQKVNSDEKKNDGLPEGVGALARHMASPKRVSQRTNTEEKSIGSADPSITSSRSAGASPRRRRRRKEDGTELTKSLGNVLDSTDDKETKDKDPADRSVLSRSSRVSPRRRHAKSSTEDGADVDGSILAKALEASAERKDEDPANRSLTSKGSRKSPRRQRKSSNGATRTEATDTNADELSRSARCSSIKGNTTSDPNADGSSRSARRSSMKGDTTLGPNADGSSRSARRSSMKGSMGDDDKVTSTAPNEKKAKMHKEKSVSRVAARYLSGDSSDKFEISPTEQSEGDKKMSRRKSGSRVQTHSPLREKPAPIRSQKSSSGGKPGSDSFSSSQSSRSKSGEQQSPTPANRHASKAEVSPSGKKNRFNTFSKLLPSSGSPAGHRQNRKGDHYCLDGEDDDSLDDDEGSRGAHSMAALERNTITTSIPVPKLSD